MTDSDSSKVIEKLTEVLNLLKGSLTKELSKKSEECTEGVKCEGVKCEGVKCEEVKCEKVCNKQCPLRKMMSEKEFEEFCKMAENMKKEDFVKICSKGDCGACPFMTKKVVFDETFENINQENSSRECFQVINTVLSLVLLVLFFIFLFRTLKGFYCTV